MPRQFYLYWNGSKVYNVTLSLEWIEKRSIILNQGENNNNIFIPTNQKHTTERKEYIHYPSPIGKFVHAVQALPINPHPQTLRGITWSIDRGVRLYGSSGLLINNFSTVDRFRIVPEAGSITGSFINSAVISSTNSSGASARMASWSWSLDSMFSMWAINWFIRAWSI